MSTQEIHFHVIDLINVLPKKLYKKLRKNVYILTTII